MLSVLVEYLHVFVKLSSAIFNLCGHDENKRNLGAKSIRVIFVV